VRKLKEQSDMRRWMSSQVTKNDPANDPPIEELLESHDPTKDKTG
jgi:hypothetical protein